MYFSLNFWMIVVWLRLLSKRFLEAKLLMRILESIFRRSRMHIKPKLTKRLEFTRGRKMENTSCNTTVIVG
jgi:hypothetical protein